LLYHEGRDLRELPLIDRKAALAGLIPAPGIVRYSEHFEDGAALFRQACTIGLEGIISKKRNVPCRSGRSKDWLKVKCSLRQEFVVAGFVRSTVSAKAIGSLVVGDYQDGKLIHAGRVGTGFSHEIAGELYRRLDATRIASSPFAKRLAREEARGVPSSGRSWWRRSSIAAGRVTTWCGMPHSRGCGRTSGRRRRW
jgi:bifunctional non-homologous end joining protein LigD